MRPRSLGVLATASLIAMGCGTSAPASGSGATQPPPAHPEGCAPGELELESGCLPAGTQENGCAAGETLLASGKCLAAGETESGCAPGTRAVRGGCVPAGVQDDGCAAGELADDRGACVPAGVPAERCGVGFVADRNGGCAPVLPDAPCAVGTMAVPGEGSCRAVAPCPAGTWGSIPVDATTQYVDAAYPCADGDGSAAKPWPTIQAGVDAAAPGAVVAIAAGTYTEAVVVGPTPVRLWARCPELVQIAPSGSGDRALWIHDTTGAEVHDLGIESDHVGLALDDSDAIVISRVWIHDTASTGLQIVASTGISVSGSLVERSVGSAIAAFGSEMDVAGTVARDTLPIAPAEGRGITASVWEGLRSDVAVHGSVVSAARDLGIGVFGSDALVEDTAVLDTQWEPGSGSGGVFCRATADGGRADLTVRGSVIRGTHGGGLEVFGSDALVEATTVDGVGTLPVALGGEGVYVGDHEDGGRANATVRASAVRGGLGGGVLVYGSDAVLESVLVRDSQESPPGDGGDGIYLGKTAAGRAVATVAGCFVDSSGGVGILAFGSDLDLEGTAVRGPPVPGPGADLEWGIGLFAEAGDVSKATVRACAIEQATRIGVAVMTSEADIDGTSIEATRSVEGAAHGLHVEGDETTGTRSVVSLRTSRMEKNEGGGVAVFGSDTTVIESAIVDTLPGDQGAFGRAISIEGSDVSGRAALEVVSSVVDQSYEAGIAVSGSDATITGTVIRGTTPAPVPLSSSLAGVVAQDGMAGEPSTIDLVGCVVEDNAGGGIHVLSSQATIEGCHVHDSTRGYEGIGRGISVDTRGSTGARAKAAVRSTVFERSADSGVTAFNADLRLEAVVVRETTATDELGVLGIGVFIGSDVDAAEPSTAAILGSIVEDTFNVGVLAKLATVELETVLIRRTRPGPDGGYGDGICVLSDGTGSATVTRSRVEDNARAGISNFSSLVAVDKTTLECNPVSLDGESTFGPSEFDDGGGNVCGCDGATEPCKVLSATLDAPAEPPSQDGS